MRAGGETLWPGWEPGDGESDDAFVARLVGAADIAGPDVVAQTIFWAVEGNVVVGRIALRHRLTAALEEFGGHVGYEVRPSHRRRGVGREMLRLLLQTEKAREIGHLLLTCAPDNVGSNKTIVANGGVLSHTVFVERVQRLTNSYWIDLR